MSGRQRMRRVACDGWKSRNSGVKSGWPSADNNQGGRAPREDDCPTGARAIDVDARERYKGRRVKLEDSAMVVMLYRR